MFTMHFWLHVSEGWLTASPLTCATMAWIRVTHLIPATSIYINAFIALFLFSSSAILQNPSDANRRLPLPPAFETVTSWVSFLWCTLTSSCSLAAHSGSRVLHQNPLNLLAPPQDSQVGLQHVCSVLRNCFVACNISDRSCSVYDFMTETNHLLIVLHMTRAFPFLKWMNCFLLSTLFSITSQWGLCRAGVIDMHFGPLMKLPLTL